MNRLERSQFNAVSETLIASLKYVESAYRSASSGPNSDPIHRAALKGLIAAVSIQVEKLEKLAGVER